MKRAKFYFGIQISLYKDRQGLKITLKFRLFKLGAERTYILKANPQWGEGNPELTPKFPDPEMFAPKPIGKVIEPEDICPSTNTNAQFTESSNQ